MYLWIVSYWYREEEGDDPEITWDMYVAETEKEAKAKCRAEFKAVYRDRGLTVPRISIYGTDRVDEVEGYKINVAKTEYR